MRGDWFRDAKFGIFIHWGLFSMHGRCVWAAYSERMPLSEYRKLADRFDARDYHPDEWVDTALEAGAKYMVLCTRQHPGFSLFDTRVSDFSAPKTAAKRDLVAEYVDACRRKGMRIGFYYSLLNWRYPSYFRGPQKDPEGWKEFLAFVHAQVVELCTNYGKIDILWYDGAWPWSAEDWRSVELNARVRALQPDILINDRSMLDEDFGTPEQRIGGRLPGDRMWETCMTMNDHWGCSPEDVNWKSTRQLIHTLAKCATRGGNLLLNVGPTPGGAFPAEAVERLRGIGSWMEKNGESIYGIQPFPADNGGPFDYGIHPQLSLMGVVGCKGSTAYLHVFHWPGTRLTTATIRNRVLSARMVATGQARPRRPEGRLDAPRGSAADGAGSLRHGHRAGTGRQTRADTRSPAYAGNRPGRLTGPCPGGRVPPSRRPRRATIRAGGSDVG